MSEIRFYDAKHEFYEFSNFYKVQILLDGKVWLSSEHYYQAQKFAHIPEYYEIIHLADTPIKCKALANQRPLTRYNTNLVVNKTKMRTLVNDVVEKYKHLTIRSDWNTVKFDVMRKVLHAKFTQNPGLKTLLLSTGDSTLVEYTPRDLIWGMFEGRGENNLGKLLMELRDLLRD